MRKHTLFRAAALLLCLIITVVCCSCTGGKDEAEGFDGAVIAIKTGGYYELAAREYTDQGAVTEVFGSLSDAAAALEAGRADYVLANEYEAQIFTDTNAKLEIASVCEYKTQFYAIFHNESKKLTQFNTAISELRENGTLDRIKSAALSGGTFNKTALNGTNGKLRFALEPSYPPMSSVDSNGDPCGIDADIANEVCANLGAELEIEPLDFDEAFQKLLADEIDVILTAVENDSERKSIVYSDCYFEMGYALLG